MVCVCEKQNNTAFLIKMIKLLISKHVLKHDKNYPIYLSYLTSLVFDYTNKKEYLQQMFNYYSLKNYALTKLKNWDDEQFRIIKSPIPWFLKKDLVSWNMKNLFYIWNQNENYKIKYYQKLKEYE